MAALTPAMQHKVLRSTTDSSARSMHFGPAGTRIAQIDAIAARGRGYDAEAAYLLSVVSAWSYSDASVLAAKLRYYGLAGAHVRQITVVNNALLVVSTAFFIQSADGKVGILSFRGTDPASFITVLSDAQVNQRPFWTGRVHAGFYANVEAVWDDAADALAAALRGKRIDDRGVETDLPNQLEALYITGHSLGGAMALLAAARLHGPGYESWNPETLIRGIYTYGQPMVGDAEFANSCPTVYRHVYRDDVVPHLPPDSGFEYAHAGEERRARSQGDRWTLAPAASTRANAALGFVSTILTAIEQRFSPDVRIGHYSIDDHLPSNYTEVGRSSLAPSTAVQARPKASFAKPLFAAMTRTFGARRIVT